jgi:hypothetical protein
MKVAKSASILLVDLYFVQGGYPVPNAIDFEYRCVTGLAAQLGMNFVFAGQPLRYAFSASLTTRQQTEQ